MNNFKIKITPVRDYNRINYHEPVSFNLIINHEDLEIIEALKEKNEEWLELKNNNSFKEQLQIQQEQFLKLLEELNTK